MGAGIGSVTPGEYYTLWSASGVPYLRQRDNLKFYVQLQIEDSIRDGQFIIVRNGSRYILSIEDPEVIQEIRDHLNKTQGDIVVSANRDTLQMVKDIWDTATLKGILR